MVSVFLWRWKKKIYFRDLATCATLIKVGINLPFKMLGNNLLQWDIIIKRTSHNVTSWGLEKHQIWMTFHDSSLTAFSQILFNIRFCKSLYIYVSVTSLLEDSTEESGFKKDFWEWPKPFLNQDSFLFQTQRNPWKVIKWWNGMKTDFKIPLQRTYL